MSPLAETILFIFGMVAVGYGVGWSGALKQSAGDALSDFVFMVAVPLLLFRTMAQIEFGGSLPWLLWFSYFGAIAVTWTVSHVAIRSVFGRDARAGVVAGLSASFSNLVLLGIPFMLGVLGQEGFAILSLIVAVHLPIMMAISIVLYEWAVRRDSPDPSSSVRPLELLKAFAKRLFSNPLIVGILAGLIWGQTGLELPALLVRMVDALAGVAGPVALFAMGMGLRKFGISGNVRPALVVSALKLFLMPATALSLALLFELPPLTAKVVVAAASLPSGINPYLVATKFGTGQALASNAMTTATAVAVVTTTFWLSVANLVL